ncbi:MAG: nucleotidyl transferase AbiEii/AbiGii toxin family protein [Betaproteobacteria bacterium]|nr:nucleotidyl transferase AbiEii/AbiGii toxin family protein [Betaproteobacteria bacterium]
MSEPAVAADYDDRGVRAAHAVLIEIGQVLGAHKDAIVIIGGSVPSLLLPDAQPSHIGSLDIDLNLDTEKLADHGYAELVEKLERAMYLRNVDGLKPFQLKRIVDLGDGGAPIAVIVDLLMPKGAKMKKHRPEYVQGLRVQEIDGGHVALRHNLKMMIAGTMPDNRPNQVEMLVASIPALLVMKGYALVQRDKMKDAYDIYFCIREFKDGIEALAAECKALMDDEVALQGYKHIAGKFDAEGGFGPETVRRFLAESEALGDMTTDQVRTDAFGQVSAWLNAIGLKE